ncbi:MAG TPA: hypothetical protein VGB37_10025 [Candidatus Lokiarchaeia archaeon]
MTIQEMVEIMLREDLEGEIVRDWLSIKSLSDLKDKIESLEEKYWKKFFIIEVKEKGKK